MLPPAGIVDRFAAPHAGGAVEIEKPASPISSAMLEHEVTIEQNRLNLRQERIVLVDVTPARLHHADSRVAEVRHQTRQKIGRRHEVGIEDRNEFAARQLQSGLERPGLEALAVRPVVILDVHALHGGAADRQLGDAAGFVDGVVQDLDFQ